MQNHAAVVRTAFLGLVVRDRIFLAVPFHHQSVFPDAIARQVLRD
jgi:hypothetical protein